MRYIWDSKKVKRKVHILNNENETYCKIENSLSYKYLDTVDTKCPLERRVCSICSHVKNKKPKKRKSKRHRKDELIRAREFLIQYFSLGRYATNLAICFRIHKELEVPLPDDINVRSGLIIDYYNKNKEKRNCRRKKGKDFYSSSKWKEVRYIALQQSEGKCNLCGAMAKDGVSLHVDHIKPRSLYPDLELQLSNLQVMCQDCNQGKSNIDDTNWRQHWESL